MHFGSTPSSAKSYGYGLQSVARKKVLAKRFVL
jgi:hypothetical protein